MNSMDSSDPASFNHRIERLSTGHTYHFVDQLPASYHFVKTPTLLCVHGFPDLWYGWRYVIPIWVQSCGWRVVVPDMLGYGGSDKPASPEHYSTKSLSADLAALLDLIGVRKAVVIGHDWGAATAWRFALWHPDRIAALVALSIPFVPRRPDYLSLEDVVERMPNFGYQLYLNDPSSTKDIETNLYTFLTLLYARPGGRKKSMTRPEKLRPLVMNGESREKDEIVLNAKELQYYLDNFKAGGMNGPLNYYRTTKHRFDEEATAQLATRLPTSLPVLFLWGDADPTCSRSQVARMHKVVPSLQNVQIEGKGHWLLIESKDVVADSVAKFVQDVFQHTSRSKL